MLKKIAAAFAFSIAASASFAQDAYPSRPIAVVVPNPPGGMNQIAEKWIYR